MLVNQPGQGVDVADDQLGAVVAGGRLGAEDEAAGLHLEGGIVHQAVVEHLHMQGVEHLALVLMQALGLGVEDEAGVNLRTLAILDEFGEALLVVPLDLGEFLAEGRVVGEGLEVLHQAGVLDPLGADGVADQLGQLGVAAHQPAAVGNAVGDGGELLGHDQVEVMEGFLLEDVAVELADAVGGEGHGHAQVGHVDLAVGDDGHLAHALGLVGEEVPQPGAQAAVHFHQDLIDPGQQGLDHFLRPLLEGLGHDGVVGVGDGLAHDGGGLVPAQTLLIHQQAHQLGDGQAGMGVVDMDDHLLRQLLPVGAVLLLEVPQDVLQGGGGEEVLLLEAQQLALVVLVLGVEDVGDGLHQLLLRRGLHIVALAELVEVQPLGGAGAPQAQAVDGGRVVADDGHIVGDGLHGVVILVHEGHAAVPLLHVHMAVEVHLAGVLHHGHFPHVAVAQPVVGQLHLLAVDDLLAEQAVFIADGAAHGGQVQGSQGVHEAGRQTAQAAVAQGGFRLFLQHGVQVDVQLGQGLLVGVGGNQVQDIAVQAAAHQEVHGQVVQALALVGLALLPGDHPLLHDLVADGGSQGAVDLLVGRLLDGAAVVALQLADDGLLDGFFIERSRGHGVRILLRALGLGEDAGCLRTKKIPSKNPALISIPYFS